MCYNSHADSASVVTGISDGPAQMRPRLTSALAQAVVYGCVASAPWQPYKYYQEQLEQDAER